MDIFCEGKGRAGIWDIEGFEDTIDTVLSFGYSFQGLKCKCIIPDPE